MILIGVPISLGLKLWFIYPLCSFFCKVLISAAGKRCQIYDVMSSTWVAVLGKKMQQKTNKRKFETKNQLLTFFYFLAIVLNTGNIC